MHVYRGSRTGVVAWEPARSTRYCRRRRTGPGPPGPSEPSERGAINSETSTDRDALLVRRASIAPATSACEHARVRLAGSGRRLGDRALVPSRICERRDAMANPINQWIDNSRISRYRNRYRKVARVAVEKRVGQRELLNEHLNLRASGGRIHTEYMRAVI